MSLVLEDQVCYTLYSTSGLVTQAYKVLLEPLSLTYPQFVVMMALWQKDDVSVTELANRIGLNKATMTPMLKRLEGMDLITRNYVQGNERQKSIVLTQSGRKLMKGGEKAAKQAWCATGLSVEETQQLMSLCQKIKLNLSK
ncbi:MarR family winged helix-turn-helix transcriptional regulator [Algicola sagamiensis]|uniref:MarR family winged helix-turn-helix transcriptional regulator n=1 Tax=Algicola sagamiensis TaxID=163869 RepID=UPI000370ADB9|nr:MarR family transcriptional regulator [Algicola sagamiensis]